LGRVSIRIIPSPSHRGHSVTRLFDKSALTTVGVPCGGFIGWFLSKKNRHDLILHYLIYIIYEKGI